MADIEKVIKGLYVCSQGDYHDCPYTCLCGYADDWPNELLTDALALLKDPDRIKVTRCKDCKHATMTSDGRLCKYCELVTDDDGCEKRVNYDANWYCGSAERRTR